MTDVAVLIRSNLIVPEGFVDISKEEMCYVEGGLYLSQSIVNNIVIGTAGTLSGLSISSLAYALNAAYNWFALQLAAVLGGFGVFLAIVGKIWFVAQVTELAKGFVASVPRQKGVDIKFGFSWIIIPGITCNAR
jgi:hypothetical protein